MPNTGQVYSRLKAMVSPPKQEDDQTLLRYRAVFGSPAGRLVLGHMLTELGFFNEVTNSIEEQARQDYAKHLLRILGILQAKNVDAIVGALMNIDYK